VSLYTEHAAFARWRTGRFGGRGMVSTYWQDVLRRDPELRSLAVCVELVFGGDSVVRVASRTVNTTSKLTGERQQWVGLLNDAITITLEYQLGNPSSNAKTLQVTLPNELVDCAGLIKVGRMLAGIAEVSLNVDGGDHDQRLVLIRGDIDGGVQFGALRELVSCSVTDPSSSSDVQLPPYVLTTERFPALPVDTAGQRIPVVLPQFAAIPALLVVSSTTTPKYAVCHDHLTIDTVYVDGTAYASSSTIYPWSQAHEVDELGEPYTRLDFTGGTAGFSGDEAVYVAVSGGPSNGVPTNIARELVQRYTVLGRAGANAGLFAEAEAKLGGSMTARCAANASGASNTTTLAFIEGELLASFPMVSMVWEGGGYGPIVTDRRGPPVAELTVGQWPLLNRATLVTESAKADLYNTFTLQYGYDPLTDTYTGVAQRSPTNSTLCAVSRAMVGDRQADVVESLWITEQAVAEAVVDWLVEHTSLPSYRVDYTTSTWVLLHLQRGDTVLLNDPEFGWSKQRATVESITYTPASCVLGLRVWARYYDIGGGSSTQGSTSGTAAPGGGGQ